MTKPDRPIPPGLAKRGITAVSDNLPPGAGIRINAREFVRLFRAELEPLVRQSQAAKAPR